MRLSLAFLFFLALHFPSASSANTIQLQVETEIEYSAKDNKLKGKYIIRNLGDSIARQVSPELVTSSNWKGESKAIPAGEEASWEINRVFTEGVGKQGHFFVPVRISYQDFAGKEFSTVEILKLLSPGLDNKILSILKEPRVLGSAYRVKSGSIFSRVFSFGEEKFYFSFSDSDIVGKRFRFSLHHPVELESDCTQQRELKFSKGLASVVCRLQPKRDLRGNSYTSHAILSWTSEPLEGGSGEAFENALSIPVVLDVKNKASSFGYLYLALGLTVLIYLLSSPAMGGKQ